MSKLLIICAAIGIWLSTVTLDTAYAIGTFRLEGPWPSSSAENDANSLATIDRYSYERVRHAHKQQRQH